MSHVATKVPAETLKQAFSDGQISKNALVSGYPGHPSPTLAALVSNGTINLGSLTGAVSLAGWGGE